VDAPPSVPQVPGKVQAIGILHLVGGILNAMAAVFWLLYGFIAGIGTFGVGLVICCPAFVLGPLGIVEIVSGARHLSSNPAGIRPPRVLAGAEIASIVFCGVMSLISGILTLVFLQDPEVAAWYESKQLPGA
jgi:hypothetical protein